MDSAESNKKTIIAGIVVLVVIALIVGGASVTGKHQNNDGAAAQLTSTTAATTASATTNARNANFKDGTYTARGSYNTPGGHDSMKLSVTITGGVISNANATTNSPDRESEAYDQMFLETYKNYVVGKSVNQVNVSRVAGASLTTQGFNNALEQIINQAQA